MADPHVEAIFPRLAGTGYDITSPLDQKYNCIAWAAGDSSRWWQPLPVGGYYWPEGIVRANTLESYELAFKRQGYRLCPDGTLEVEFEKVALYVDAGGVPTHAARQLPDGRWASKLGQGYDIEHDRPEDVGGTIYGEVTIFLRRKMNANRPHPSARNIR